MERRPDDEPPTLTGVLEKTFAASPAAPFLVSAAGESMSYDDARRRSSELGRALRRAGVAPGDRVAVQLEKSPLALLLYLACLRTGAVFVPVNTTATEPEVEYLIGDVDPALVVRDPSKPSAGRRPMLTANQMGAGTLADLASGEPTDLDPLPLAGGDLATILYTSGTTGRPKGAPLTQANLASNAEALSRTWAFRADDVLLHALPLFHTHGLLIATNCVLVSGSSLVLLARFEVSTVVRELLRCTVFMGVPTFYTRLLGDERLTPALCRGVRLFTCGSAPLPAPVHEDFRTRTGHAIVERYGMTETTIITSNRIGDETPGSVGRPLRGVEVRIGTPSSAGVVAGDGTPSSAGVVAGPIEVRGPNVFAGYWRMPETARTEFTADGFFKTGDLGHLDAAGRLTIVGRLKDLVISGGLNVYPKEVEDTLDAIDGILECAVVGAPDGDLGELVVAFVVARPGVDVDPEVIRATARQSLAAYKVPKRVHVIDSLPRNAMGKVEKAVLRERLVSGRLV